jgi:hypothetical protein
MDVDPVLDVPICNRIGLDPIDYLPWAMAKQRAFAMRDRVLATAALALHDVHSSGTLREGLQPP